MARTVAGALLVAVAAASLVAGVRGVGDPLLLVAVAVTGCLLALALVPGGADAPPGGGNGDRGAATAVDGGPDPTGPGAVGHAGGSRRATAAGGDVDPAGDP